MPAPTGNCQLCDWVHARNGNRQPPSLIKVAGVGLCERHAGILVAIAAESGVNLADEYLRRSA
jgi:hypothetical protein